MVAFTEYKHRIQMHLPNDSSNYVFKWKMVAVSTTMMTKREKENYFEWFGKQEGKKGKNMKLYDWPVRLRISVLNHNTVTVETRVASQCKCYSATIKSTARTERYLTDQNTKTQTHRPRARQTINLPINHRSTNWMSQERWCGRNFSKIILLDGNNMQYMRQKVVVAKAMLLWSGRSLVPKWLI